MIRLAAFDIDRTLVSPSNHTVAPETAEALRKLKANGVKIAIATGRQWQQLPRALKELDFDCFVLLNGAHITDGSGNTLHREMIPAEDVISLMNDVAGAGHSLHLRFESGLYSVLEKDRITPFGMKIEEVPEELREGILQESPFDEGELPIAALGEIPPQLQSKLIGKYPQLDFFRVMGGKNCDINPRGITKAAGLQKICDIYGFEMAQTIAFGDDINDLEIIRDAGIGVAMGDAMEEVKAVADYVTDTCDNLGVIKGLKHFGLLD